MQQTGCRSPQKARGCEPSQQVKVRTITAPIRECRGEREDREAANWLMGYKWAGPRRS